MNSTHSYSVVLSLDRGNPNSSGTEISKADGRNSNHAIQRRLTNSIEYMTAIITLKMLMLLPPCG